MAKKKERDVFERISIALTHFTGSTAAFVISISLVILWLLLGPIFDFSESWQLVINSCTTIITFIMVFVIQRTQNKDSMAIQLKLNELIAAAAGASNRMVDIEDISEAELEILHRHYKKLARLFENDKHLKETHSIEEAEKRHQRKAAKK
ncbi:MAG TPA: low affinity iron permease family protein [Ignavibacteria bacterium]|nr:low affinity iron permease family protein [Ignavibacteria bacterium]